MSSHQLTYSNGLQVRHWSDSSSGMTFLFQLCVSWLVQYFVYEYNRFRVWVHRFSLILPDISFKCFLRTKSIIGDTLSIRILNRQLSTANIIHSPFRSSYGMLIITTPFKNLSHIFLSTSRSNVSFMNEMSSEYTHRYKYSLYSKKRFFVINQNFLQYMFYK